MTLTMSKISHITRENLASWIENTLTGLDNLALDDLDRAWAATRRILLQVLAEDGKGEYTKWLKAECSCGKRLLMDNPMYRVYLYQDHFTISCICGKTHQFGFQLVEAPIEVPF